MIAPHLVEQVRKLLNEDKLSHRKIARLTGVSRGTIGAIASGRRHIRPRTVYPWEEEPLVSDIPPERCPDCGGMVYMPCRVCRTQKEIDRSPTLRTLTKARDCQPIVLLGLNLKPVHRERYEEVRRWRREQLFLQAPCGANRNSTAGQASSGTRRAPGAAVQLPPQHSIKPSP